MVAAEYPLAFTLAAAFAISTVQASLLPTLQYSELRIPNWLFAVPLILLGAASFAVGILNPETMALVGMEGFTSP